MSKMRIWNGIRNIYFAGIMKRLVRKKTDYIGGMLTNAKQGWMYCHSHVNEKQTCLLQNGANTSVLLQFVENAGKRFLICPDIWDEILPINYSGVIFI